MHHAFGEDSTRNTHNGTKVRAKDGKKLSNSHARESPIETAENTCPKNPTTQHWNLSINPLYNNVPHNTPSGSSYAHEKMGTNDPNKKMEW